MHNFKAAFMNELYKISKRKKITVAAIVTFAIIALGALLTSTVSNFAGINLTGNSEFALLCLPVFVYIAVPLFIIFVTNDLFCGEFSDNTVKTTLLTPATRVQIFSAKVCVVLVFAAYMLALAMVLGFVVGVIIGQTEYAFIRIFFSYLLSLLPIGVIVAMAALISNLAKGSGSSFLICVAVYILSGAAGLIYPSAVSFLPTGSMGMYILLGAPLISFGKIIRLLLICIGYSVMLYAAGISVFDAREI